MGQIPLSSVDEIHNELMKSERQDTFIEDSAPLTNYMIFRFAGWVGTAEPHICVVRAWSLLVFQEFSVLPMTLSNGRNG